MIKSLNQFEPDSDGFYDVCLFSDLREKEGKKFFINDTEIALFKIESKIYCLSNICPHQHSAIIYSGFIEDGCVVCPAHGWKFNLTDGKKESGSKGLDSFETKVVDNIIRVKVIQKKYLW